jgi:hypothetical protein
MLLLSSFSTLANATDYYYCDCKSGASTQCTTGLDTNTGLTVSAPKQTFADAGNTFSKLAAGDSILFCRGGSFDSSVSILWRNTKCTVTNRCTVSSYDLPGNVTLKLPRPIITNLSDRANLFFLRNSTILEHAEGYSFSNLDLRCSVCLNSGTSNAFLFYNDIDKVDISNISIDGFRDAIQLVTATPGGDPTSDGIILSNLRINNNKSQGILGKANDLIIRDSYFENNGSGANREHNIFISGGNNITIKGNELYRSSLDANANCNSDSIVVHGIVNNLVIENNIIREDLTKATSRCRGITVVPGYATPESFSNIIIRSNKIINVGSAIGIASCDTCIIENNVILQQQVFNVAAISASDRPGSVDDQALNKVTIRNNSIMTNSNRATIVLGTEGSGHIVVSNAIHYTGSANYTCFNFDLPASAYTAIDNNICYFPNALTSSKWEAGTGTTPTPLAAWQASSGFGLNSKNENPGFKSPNLPSINFSNQNLSSAIVNSGHKTLSSTFDIQRKIRDSSPDVGAFESGAINPPARTTLYFN